MLQFLNKLEKIEKGFEMSEKIMYTYMIIGYQGYVTLYENIAYVHTHM